MALVDLGARAGGGARRAGAAVTAVDEDAADDGEATTVGGDGEKCAEEMVGDEVATSAAAGA